MGDNLPLPEQRATSVYKNIVAILKNDDVLRSVIQTWQVGDGGEEWVAPTETALPCLRLIPNVMRVQLADEVAYQEEMEILFDFTVAGTDPAPRMNLWGAIRDIFLATQPVTLKALVDGTQIPDGSIMLNVLRQAGATVVKWETPAIFQYDPRTAIPIVNQRSLARLTVKLLVPN